jgi:hypothetical protein
MLLLPVGPIGLEFLQTKYSFITCLIAQLRFNNDSAACFDHIVLALGSIISHLYSIPKEVTSIQASIVKKYPVPHKNLPWSLHLLLLSQR